MKENQNVRLSLVDGSLEAAVHHEFPQVQRLVPVYEYRKITINTLEGEEEVLRLFLVGFKDAYGEELE